MAAEEGRTVSELIEEGLRFTLEGKTRPVVTRTRVPLPLIQGGRAASPGKEITPEKAAEILSDQETIWAL